MLCQGTHSLTQSLIYLLASAMRKLLLSQPLKSSDLGLEDVRSFRDMKNRRSSVDIDSNSSSHSTNTPPRDNNYAAANGVDVHKVLTHSLTHLLTHSLTHLLTYLLTCLLKAESLAQYLMDCIIPVSFEELKNRLHLENISGSPVPAHKSNNDNGKVFFYSLTHTLTYLLIHSGLQMMTPKKSLFHSISNNYSNDGVSLSDRFHNDIGPIIVSHVLSDLLIRKLELFKEG